MLSGVLICFNYWWKFNSLWKLNNPFFLTIYKYIGFPGMNINGCWESIDILFSSPAFVMSPFNFFYVSTWIKNKQQFEWFSNLKTKNMYHQFGLFNNFPKLKSLVLYSSVNFCWLCAYFFVKFYNIDSLKKITKNLYNFFILRLVFSFTFPYIWKGTNKV